MDTLQLRRQKALVRLSWAALRPALGPSLPGERLLPVSQVPGPLLREPAREEQLRPRPAQVPEDTDQARGQREHVGAVPGQAQGDALEDVPATVRAPRGRLGAVC